jgi:hypothetical protein
MRAEGEDLESMRAIRAQGPEGEEGEEVGTYSGAERVEYSGAELPREHAGAATGAPRLATGATGAGGVARGGRGGEGAEEARPEEARALSRKQEPREGDEQQQPEQRQPEQHPVAQQQASVRVAQQGQTVAAVHGTSMRVADSRGGVGASPTHPRSIQSATRWRREENGYAEGREEREMARKASLEERDKGREEVVTRGNCSSCTWGEEEVLSGEEEVLWCDGRRPCQVVSSHPRPWESACHASDPLLPSSSLLCPPPTHTHKRAHKHKQGHTHTHTRRECVLMTASQIQGSVDESIRNIGLRPVPRPFVRSCL